MAYLHQAFEILEVGLHADAGACWGLAWLGDAWLAEVLEDLIQLVHLTL